MCDVTHLVEHLFRRQSAQMAVQLTRAIGTRHLPLAEEAVQDALVAALQQWPYRRLPADGTAREPSYLPDRVSARRSRSEVGL